MKTLIAAADFPPWDGGISQVAYEYARALARAGHDVTVLCPDYGKSGPWDHGQPYAITRYRTHNAFFVNYWLLKRQFKKMLRKKAFDWVLCMRWNFDGIALMPQRRAVPVVFQWYHGSELFDRHIAIRRWNDRLKHLMAGVSRNIAVSDYTADLLRERFPGCPRIETVRLGVDAVRFSPPDSVSQAKASLRLSGKTVLLTVGRLVERKGQDIVIKSLALLKDIPDLLYVIGGKGAYADHLRQLARQTGVADRVHFAGFIPADELAAYYQACDVFVMPSRSEDLKGKVEGFGLTFLEANACGKPVVGGLHGGCHESVADGVSGFLVDARSTQAVADAIRKLVNDRQLYARMAASALERARTHFSWDASASRLIELYGRCKNVP